MASSGNFATLNPLNTRGSSASSQITNGNLQYNGQATGDEADCSTISIGNDGVPKVYFEVYIINNHDTGWLGIYDTKVTTLKYERTYGTTSYRAMKFNTGQKVTGSTSSNYIGDGSENNSRSGQTVGVAIDIPNGKIWFAYNNAWGGDGGGSPTDSNVAFTDLTTTGSYQVSAHMGGASVAQPDWLFNYGQDSTMQGRVTAGGNADDNGFGDFRYAPPTGFVALCSANINISADIDPAQTDDDYPAKQFNVVTYTGNGSTINVTGAGFQPDFVWLKMRSPHSYNHMMFDTNRGATKHISSDRSNSEFTTSNSLTSFDSDGFTYGSELSGNDSGDSFVAWCWKANGGTTVSNSSGDITSTVQANTKAGFSIVTYTGNGSSAQSIGHGLSSGAPELIFVKNRDAADSWAVYHHSLGNAAHMILDTGAGQTTSSAYWGSFTPTTSLFKVGSDHKLNASGEKYVAYLWHGVEGYSKFGFYDANQNADGPFIYTGFRPRMIFIKMTVTGDGWGVWDSERGPSNVIDNIVQWNTTGTESSNSYYNVDFLSNGFKIRSSNAQVNHTSYDPYIWGAWGDVPFKYNNTF
jgi:hypothetical protein